MKQVLEYSYEFDHLVGTAYFYVRVGEDLVPVQMEAHTLSSWLPHGGPLTFVRSEIAKKIGHNDFELMKTGGGQNA